MTCVYLNAGIIHWPSYIVGAVVATLIWVVVYWAISRLTR